MKKIFLCISISCLLMPVFCAELCQEFDDQAHIITVDCITRERIITQADTNKNKETKVEVANEQKILKQKQEKENKKKKLKSEPKKQQIKSEEQNLQINDKKNYLSKTSYKQKDIGVKSGDWMISIAGGGGGYLGGSIKSDYTNYDMKNSSLWGASLSITKFVNSYFGLGLEVGGDLNINSSLTKYFWGPGYSGDISSQMSVYKLLLLGRINLNPGHATRLYVPFGVGYTSIEEKRSTEMATPAYSFITDKYTASSVGYFAGIGFEFNLTKNVSLGLEGRYNGFIYHSEPFAYLNGLIKLNVKF